MKITTGIYKFKKIHTLKSYKLRPTSNKIRNAVFNILDNKYMMSSWSTKAHLLDAFSGSGIVAIEGLSRNINKATLIEADSAIFENLQKNVKELNLKKKVKLIEKHNENYFKYDDPKNSTAEVKFKNPNIFIKNFFSYKDKSNFSGKSSIKFLKTRIKLDQSGFTEDIFSH